MLATYIVTKPVPVAPPPPTITFTLTVSVAEGEALQQLSNEFVTDFPHCTLVEFSKLRAFQRHVFHVVTYALAEAKTT